MGAAVEIRERHGGACPINSAAKIEQAAGVAAAVVDVGGEQSGRGKVTSECRHAG